MSLSPMENHNAASCSTHAGTGALIGGGAGAGAIGGAILDEVD